MTTPSQASQDLSQQARDAWATAISAPTRDNPSEAPGQGFGQPGKMAPPRLSCVALEKSYRKGELIIPVLRGIDLELAPAEFLSVVGQSGSGKSTLLHVLGLLDAPNVGEVHCDGRRIDNLNERQRDTLRHPNFGFIFQSYHLLPELTLLENVISPLAIRHSALTWWTPRPAMHEQAREMLDKVGLETLETELDMEHTLDRFYELEPQIAEPLNPEAEAANISVPLPQFEGTGEAVEEEKDELTLLQHQLQQAVLCEEYEEAARLRDAIETLANRPPS